MKRLWPSAKMMSKAKEDLPEPDTPVRTVICWWGMETEIFFRLCSRAPMRSRDVSLFFGIFLLVLALIFSINFGLS